MEVLVAGKFDRFENRREGGEAEMMLLGSRRKVGRSKRRLTGRGGGGEAEGREKGG